MTHIENARRTRAGAASLKFGGFKTQHNRFTDKTQCADTGNPLAGQRFERQITRIHNLGVRPLAEMIVEIATATGQLAAVADRIEAYAALDAEIIRFLGGDRFPPAMVEVVR